MRLEIVSRNGAWVLSDRAGVRIFLSLSDAIAQGIAAARDLRSQGGPGQRLRMAGGRGPIGIRHSH